MFDFRYFKNVDWFIVQSIYDQKGPNLELIPTKEISIDFDPLVIPL